LFANRFKTEARVLYNLRHKNVLFIWAVCEIPGGDFYVIMDLMARGDLRQVSAVSPGYIVAIICSVIKMTRRLLLR
jgi:serine/threonine protein kinase